ncbi:MAG: hypothetical protein ACO3A2_01080 [Bdellovibrionia bacterium]
MSKANSAQEKGKIGSPAEPKEKTKEIHGGAAAQPGAKHAAEAKPTSSKHKAHAVMPGGCFCYGCKREAVRFNFCNEHYEHFKFGLIKKTGEPVSDYEKKIDHFLAYQAKRKVTQVA